VLQQNALFRLGYNTNGLAHHRLLDALRLLADLGYEGVAITPDVGQLDPLRPEPRLVEQIRNLADELGLELAIETGARFVLDPRRKHYPTLLEEEREGRQKRIDLLCRCVELASELSAGVVSLWSGAAPGGLVAATDGQAKRTPQEEVIWERLCSGLKPVIERGVQRAVQIAFEPEPGMFVERCDGYLRLLERLGSDGDSLGLCLDVGHTVVTGEIAVDEQIRQLAPRLVHVHLDDCRRGVHEHLLFGSGDLDLPAALRALLEAGYDGMAAVELSRDSHRGAWAAEESLRRILSALPNRS
jgi:L-ribulose-5-phosphate 3-epimerase